MGKLSQQDDAWLKRQITEAERRGWSEKRARRLARRLRKRLGKTVAAEELVSLVNRFELFPCHSCKQLFNRSMLKAIVFGKGYCVPCSDRDFGGS